MSEYTSAYKLSLYKELTVFHESNKSRVVLVQDIRDNKIYIEKILTNYNIEVYTELQKLKNSGIPKIFELFEVDSQLVVIEEYINGKTLQEYLDLYGKLHEDSVIEYMIKLCDTLEVMHNLTKPIIHRDIKPSNIIIDNAGNLKIIDFDVSRMYKEFEDRDTRILGTEGYASPEQFGFRQTDGRSDIYSIGIMMNVLTTGKMPREEKNMSKLSKIISKCIEISQDERYKTVAELKNELENYDKPVKVRKINKNPIRNIPGFRRGNLLLVLIAAIWYLFLIYGITSSLMEGNMQKVPKDFIVGSLLILYTLLYSNFLNVHDKLPLLKEANKYKKLLGFVLYTLLLLIIGGIILAFFQ